MQHFYYLRSTEGQIINYKKCEIGQIFQKFY